MTEDIKAKVRDMHLAELKAGVLGWYYISVADEEFRGGFVLRAFGPTDAWRLLHNLGWYESGSTETYPIPEDAMGRIPEEQRWRKLTRDEAINLGKGYEPSPNYPLESGGDDPR